MGLLLAVVIWALALVCVLVMKDGHAGMPATISDNARSIDAQFFLTLVITGITFVLAQGLLGWFIFKYRGKQGRKAVYTHGNKTVEVGGALVVGIVFVILAFMGQRVWMQIHLHGSDANALVVDVTGEQFAWNVRYPGPDGKFGRTSPKLYDPTSNPVGIDPDDPAGKDDIVALNNVAVPVNRPVELALGSKDVLHSFFLPVLRIKQDTVPGMRIPLRFTATQTGDFEVPCAELCGLGHYRMKGFLHVMEPDKFQAWLVEQKSQ